MQENKSLKGSNSLAACPAARSSCKELGFVSQRRTSSSPLVDLTDRQTSTRGGNVGSRSHHQRRRTRGC